MKKLDILLIAILSISLLGFNSCKKTEGCTDSTATNYNPDADEDDGSCIHEDPPQTSSEPTNYTPAFSGEYAGLIAVRTLTTTSLGAMGDQDVEMDVAVAVFSNDGGGSFLDAGTVTCSGETLEKHDNNSYVFAPSMNNPQGINFGSTINWKATGGAWQAFDEDTESDFPELGKLNEEETVSISSRFTLETETIDGADSVYFAVHGPENSIFVIKPGNTPSNLFSADQMETLGKGQGFIQVAAMKYDRNEIDQKDYWFIKESVRTSAVTFE